MRVVDLNDQVMETKAVDAGSEGADITPDAVVGIESEVTRERTWRWVGYGTPGLTSSTSTAA